MNISMQIKNNIIKLHSKRVWRTYLGGEQISRWHGLDNPVDNEYPEEWIASVNMSISAEGKELADGLAGLADNDNVTLKSVIDAAPQLYLGNAHVDKHGNSLGMLTKMIDSLTRLGIQVHPDKNTAMEMFSSHYGKTESWYIVGGRTIDGEPPHVFLGFKKGVTKERLFELFEKQDCSGMLGCLHRIEVKPGDVLIIKGGVPHAIGKGCFLIELQEPTDYTFRLEKTAPSGVELSEDFMSLGLGFQRMFECFDYGTYSLEEVLNLWMIKPKISESDGVKVITLIDSDTTELFGMLQISAMKRCTVDLKNSFAVAIMLEGKGRLCKGEERVLLNQGETAFLPIYAGNVDLEPESGRETKLVLCFPPK